jgi:PD-(D/E)XK nuclease superfamily protein
VELTPVQERTLVDLMASDIPRPTFRRDVASRLGTLIETLAAPSLSALPEGQRIVLSKSGLTTLHARCEGLYLANALGEGGGFEFSLPLAIGKLVHKAVEADVVGERLGENELVEKALHRMLSADPEFQRFFEELDEIERSELVGEAIRRVVLFRATLPPLQKSWAPVPELRIKHELLGGRLLLSGTVDLSLGKPRDETPMEGRRLFIELKTGIERPEFVDDLRFYALVATLRFGVPPFRVVTLMLEDGTYRFEDVTEDILEAAARRAAAAASRHVELLRDLEPVLRPGPWCSWCPRRDTCPESMTRK